MCCSRALQTRAPLSLSASLSPGMASALSPWGHPVSLTILHPSSSSSPTPFEESRLGPFRRGPAPGLESSPSLGGEVNVL